MLSHPGKVLIVDDETNIRHGLRTLLSKDGHQVRDAATAEEALELLKTFPVEAAVVDIRMPGMPGTELLAEIRQRWPHVAVVLLTGHGTLESAMTAIKEGAHDYLLKPAQPAAIREVVAEALAAARHRRDQDQLLQTLRDGLQRLDFLPDSAADRRVTRPQSASRELTIGDLYIDLQAHLVRQEGVEIELTPSEYNLLVTLARRAGEVIDYVSLVNLALEYEAELWEAKELIKRHVFTLRQKIEPDPGEPRYVRNVRGVGYRLAEPDA